MSTTRRNPFSNVDSNQIQQQSNKPPHHRRRPSSKKSIGSDKSSLASLVDDSEFDFLSNPKPSPKQDVPQHGKRLVTTKGEQSAKPKIDGKWNSSSKTPKISNVSAILSNEPIIFDESKVKTKELSVQDPIKSKSTNATIEKSYNAQSALHKSKKNAFNVVPEETASNKLSSETVKIPRDHHQRTAASTHPPTLKHVPQRSKKSTDDNSSTHSKSNKTTNLLETIVEGTSEEESDSPISVHKHDLKTPHNSQVDFRTDNDSNQENDIERSSDMDESSDDELMGLTLSPKIPPDCEVTEDNKLYHEKGISHTHGTNQFGVQIKPTQVKLSDVSAPASSITVKQEERFHTPTQPHTQVQDEMVKKSTPHPDVSIPRYTKPPNTRVNLQVKQSSINIKSKATTVAPRPLGERPSIQDTDKTNRKNKVDDYESDTVVRINENLKKGLDENMYLESSKNDKAPHQSNYKCGANLPLPSNVKSMLTPIAGVQQNQKLGQAQNNRTATPHHDSKGLTKIGYQVSFHGEKLTEKKRKQNLTTIKHPTIGTGKCLPVEPIDKKVWQAMMGNADEIDPSLVGLIIETPAHKAKSDVVETESIDGSELTQDTYSLLYLNRSHDQNLDSVVKVRNTYRIDSNLETKTQECFTLEPFASTSYADSFVEGGNNEEANISKNEERLSKETVQSVVVSRIPSDQKKTISKSEMTISSTVNNTNVSKRIETAIGRETDNIRQSPDHTIPASPVLQTPISFLKYKQMPSQAFINSEHNRESEQNKIGRVTVPSPSADLFQEDLHSGIVSACMKSVIPKGINPKLWTAEIAGRKFKALGVNTAPVFRLLDGTYYHHPPLPPGWTVVVSRTKNIPFYMHPDFGATFYSPVPLPSNDGTTTGTTLLYQADTPIYRPPLKSFSKSPVIFGEQRDLHWSDQTSVVATQQLTSKLHTPVGAMVLSKTNTFYESQFGAISNTALQRQLIGVTPLIAQDKDFESDVHESPSTTSSASTTATMTVVSHYSLKRGIPCEIEIVKMPENEVDDDRFTRDLANTSNYEANLHRHSPQVVLEDKETHFIATLTEVPETDSKPSILIDSDETSLQWATGISLGSCKSEAINRHRNGSLEDMQDIKQDPVFEQSMKPNRFELESVPSNGKSHKSNVAQISTCISEEKHEQPTPEIDTDQSPSFAMNDDNSPSVPRNILVGSDMDDDMSLLQNSPQLNDPDQNPLTQKRAHFAGALPTIIDNGGDHYTYEKNSHTSVFSGSHFSGYSYKSRASFRCRHPKLPLCSLQNLVDTSPVSKKRKKTSKRNPVKRLCSLNRVSM